jgi:hypothetical protein
LLLIANVSDVATVAVSETAVALACTAKTTDEKITVVTRKDPINVLIALVFLKGANVIFI